MPRVVFALFIFSSLCGTILVGAVCDPKLFECDNGRCIHRVFVCDDTNDCYDNSDERGCPKPKTLEEIVCKEDEFKCLDKMCIPEEWVCNGEDDCLDASDEILGCSNHTCDDNDFHCANGYCIPFDWVCDGGNDCSDNSDELNCAKHMLPVDKCTSDSGYYLCKNNDCILESLVCNNKNDCEDNSDEDAVGCAKAAELCKSNHCSHGCVSTPSGPVCTCPTGYSYSPENNRTCQDINECAIYGICDQRCKNLQGSYTCSCDEGYILQKDKKTCKALGEALMIFSSKTDIRGLYLDSLLYFSVARNLQHIVGVSLDVNHVYWSDIQMGDEAIVRSKEDDSEREVIVSSGLGSPEEIALDWVTGNVYFTDSLKKHIGVCTNNGSACTVIIQESMDKPRGLALLPSKGEIFWSDWGESPQIRRAGMDGGGSMAFITTNIVWPNGLTIDYPNSRLYWVDAKLKIIQSILIDGGDRRIVLKKIAKHPYSIAIFENRLYWSDQKTNSIQTCNKFTGKDHSVLVKENQPIYGVHIYHSTLRPNITNPCQNTFCSHICLIAAGGRSYTCSCPLEMELQKNKRTCEDSTARREVIVGAGNMFIHFHHVILGKPKLEATMLSMHISAITYDSMTQTILATDFLHKVIVSYNKRKLEFKNLVELGDGLVSGMDFDRLGNNLYWCDIHHKTIEVYSLNSGERTVLQSFQGEPIDLALIPEHGIMYVVFLSMGSYHIDKMQMDGRGNRVHVIQNHILGPKVSIVYDRAMRRIFWADQGTGRIESTSAEGTDRHLFRTGLREPVSLAIVGPDIFWTNYGSRKVYWADKTGHIPGNKKITMDVPDNLRLMHLVPRSETDYNIHHICHRNNGGCSHICLVVSEDTNICACPEGMILDIDHHKCKRDNKCKQNEMRCTADEKCIDKSKRCNGIPDCLDGEDEKNCPKRPSCGKTEFTCDEGQCIDIAKRCDSNYDCIDRSDEKDCNHKACKADEFQCRQGDCISEFLVCNGFDDCSDLSDEENCGKRTCDSKSFACQSGGCIPDSWKCDGEIDCADKSDESDSCEPVTCGPGMFTCLNGHCVDQLLFCNKIDECGDNSDENDCPEEKDDISINCKENEIPCHGTNECIPEAARCDGKKDCPKGDDELSCPMCNDNEFTCENGNCIPKLWVCDLANDCHDNSDEGNCSSSHQGEKNITMTGHCEEYRCHSGSCLQFENVCDGKPDCYDGSDEGGKCATSCDSDNRCEGICQKTPSGPVCSCAEGFRDTGDGYSCEDINECELNVCSQLCHNMLGSYSCYCYDGYVLRNDRTSCKVTGPQMEIIVATVDDIRRITPALHSVGVVYNNPNVGINGLDVDINRNLIYWSTEMTGSINQMTLEGKEMKTVTSIGKPGLLAVDWATSNIYFTDNESPQQSIKVCNLEEQKCARVTNIETGTTVKAIAVDPKHGWLFWGQTSWWMHNTPSSEIYRSDMTGANVTVIASNKLGFVSGIAIDHLRSHLYWVDRKLKIIERTDLHGGNREMVMSTRTENPLGLNIFEDSLFWFAPGSGQLTSCPLYGKNKTCRKEHIRSSHYQEMFAVFQLSRQPPVENHCYKHKCSYMCVSKMGEPGCMCHDGIMMNGTCSENPDIGEFGTKTFGMSKQELSKQNGTVTALIVMIVLAIAALAAYFYYQKKKLNLDKYDLSIHFQNPSFGCRNDYVPEYRASVLPPGEHEYANPMLEISTKALKAKEEDGNIVEIVESDHSESECEGNYSPDTHLIQ